LSALVCSGAAQAAALQRRFTPQRDAQGRAPAGLSAPNSKMEQDKYKTEEQRQLKSIAKSKYSKEITSAADKIPYYDSNDIQGIYQLPSYVTNLPYYKISDKSTFCSKIYFFRNLSA